MNTIVRVHSNTRRHLLTVAATHFNPLVHVGGLESVCSDAGCTVGVFEGEVAQRAHQRSFAGPPLPDNDERDAAPRNSDSRVE